MLSKKEFKAELERHLKSRLTDDHPIINELFKLRDPRLLRMMVIQGYQLTKVFAIYVGGIYYKCPLAKHRKQFAYNIFEEETGKLSKTEGHLELLNRFTRAIGITADELNNTPVNPETQELIDYRFRMIDNPATFHKGVSAVMIASEGQNLEERAGAMRRDVVAKGFGIDSDDLIFFKVHAEEDVYHVQDGLNCVVDLCTTKQMQDEAIEAIHETCDRFWNHYDGILREYKKIAPEVVLN